MQDLPLFWKSHIIAISLHPSIITIGSTTLHVTLERVHSTELCKSPLCKVIHEDIRCQGRKWQKAIGVHERMETMPLHYVEYIVSNSEMFASLKQEGAFLKQITTEIETIFPYVLENLSFMRNLSNVLIAYLFRNPSLKYSKYWSIIATALLIFMDDEYAFWMLAHIIENLMPDYFVPSMAGLVKDVKVFESFLLENLPSLSCHFKAIQLDLQEVSSPWFLSLFLNNLHPEVVFDIWDDFMEEGSVVVFEVALAILCSLQQELMNLNESKQVIEYVRAHERKIPYRVLKAHWRKLDRKDFETRRASELVVEKKMDVRVLMTQYSDLTISTKFTHTELANLWRQCVSLDPYLCLTTNGLALDITLFSKFIEGTFSEWWVDKQLLERLFRMTDSNKDGRVDFPELVALLSVMCRGTTEEQADFICRLFGRSKGLLKTEFLVLITSTFGMFKDDSMYLKLVNFFVDEIFRSCDKGSGTILRANYTAAISFMPQILQRFMQRNPTRTYKPQQSFYYWMFDPNKDSKLVKYAKHSSSRNSLPWCSKLCM